MRVIWLIIIVLAVIFAASFAWFALSPRNTEPPSELEARHLAEDDRFVEIAGARVRVREEGPEDAPVLILLHGFTWSLESWDGWAEELDDSYRIVRYDLLGHGLTGPDAQQRYFPHERSAFLGEVMDALEIDQAHLAGNSLGGLVAWRFAVENPDRVDRLVLVDSGAYSINGVTDEPVQAPLPLAMALRAPPDFFIDQIIAMTYADPETVSAERRAVIADMMRAEGNGDAFVEHINEFVLPDPTPELARLQAPTLVIWGGQGRLIDPGHAQLIFDAAPQAELAMFEELGHAPHEENPQATAEAVRAFLSQTQAGEGE
jgi:pimeloyl-ACP methyl ester carboxylesterase